MSEQREPGGKLIRFPLERRLEQLNAELAPVEYVSETRMTSAGLVAPWFAVRLRPKVVYTSPGMQLKLTWPGGETLIEPGSGGQPSSPPE